MPQPSPPNKKGPTQPSFLLLVASSCLPQTEIFGNIMSLFPMSSSGYEKSKRASEQEARELASEPGVAGSRTFRACSLVGC